MGQANHERIDSMLGFFRNGSGSGGWRSRFKDHRLVEPGRADLGSWNEPKLDSGSGVVNCKPSELRVLRVWWRRLFNRELDTGHEHWSGFMGRELASIIYFRWHYDPTRVAWNFFTRRFREKREAADLEVADLAQKWLDVAHAHARLSVADFGPSNGVGRAVTFCGGRSWSTKNDPNGMMIANRPESGWLPHALGWIPNRVGSSDQNALSGAIDRWGGSPYGDRDRAREIGKMTPYQAAKIIAESPGAVPIRYRKTSEGHCCIVAWMNGLSSETSPLPMYSVAKGGRVTVCAHNTGLRPQKKEKKANAIQKGVASVDMSNLTITATGSAGKVSAPIPGGRVEFDLEITNRGVIIDHSGGGELSTPGMPVAEPVVLVTEKMLARGKKVADFLAADVARVDAGEDRKSARKAHRSMRLVVDFLENNVGGVN